MKTTKILALSLISCLILNACKKDSEGDPEPVVPKSDVPEFYKTQDPITPLFSVIASASSSILEPQDLDFNPTRPNELWVINKGVEATGGSTVMFTKVGTPDQVSDYRTDGNARHFMSLPSAISFSNTGNWSTSANVQDANHQGGTYTGPTLWSGNLNIYAKYAGPGTNGSHLDMLHGSPYSMGIESEKDNIYWVYDGYNKHIVKYNFNSDHGPGNDDHSDGKIHRYKEIKLLRNPLVPSHLVLDKDKKWLYIIDGGNKRVLRMDITSGSKLKNLANTNEVLAEHWEMTGVIWEEFLPATFGLKQPCGIDIKDNRLFISDYETGEIVCVDINTKKEIARVNTGKKGIMGIKIGPDGKLWFVNAITSQLLRLDPQ